MWAGTRPQRLQCLRNVPASTIRAYTNGPDSGLFALCIDNVIAFDDPLQRIRTGQIARVPILLGNMQDDGTTLTYNTSESLSTFLTTDRYASVASSVPPDKVRGLYPGLADPQVIAATERDILSRCPTKLWSDAFVSSGIRSVYRYTYGAIFADLQPFPDLGVWHGSELPILFGTFNRSTASSAEVELSQSLQTAFANFVKNPNSSPAPHWPAYQPEVSGSACNPLAKFVDQGNVDFGNFVKNPNLSLAPHWSPYEPEISVTACTPTLAKIAYQGNVDFGNFIQPVQPDSTDGPCNVWDEFLDYRP
ncbi:Alpha/Beta hydrolase protein [Russula aff. rugulosa BPL654]|nr:Alpha/Beta hydrolase protein [Russula aff. rugulosa BPL654]